MDVLAIFGAAVGKAIGAEIIHRRKKRLLVQKISKGRWRSHPSDRPGPVIDSVAREIERVGEYRWKP